LKVSRSQVAGFYPSNFKRSLIAITGIPVAGYFVSPAKPLLRETGEFDLMRSLGAVLGFHLTLPTR
jgi:hypothetical protein